MASAPQQSLPLFYNGLEPLSSETHANWKLRTQDSAPFLIGVHAVPLTVEEFPMAQRTMPIVFSLGDDAIPLGLMGLNEGVNVFVNAEGQIEEPNVYVPAYVRRYPFMLAKLRPDTDDLSLCFDPTSPAVGAFEDGVALFDGSEPSQATKDVLGFAQSFEEAGLRSQNFMRELREAGLLIDGEMTIQPQDAQQPFVYRGFQMVDEAKLADLRGDQLRKMMKSGMLPLIHAHLFSLATMREIFARQQAQGKVVQPQFQMPA